MFGLVLTRFGPECQINWHPLMEICPTISSMAPRNHLGIVVSRLHATYAAKVIDD